MSAVAPITTQSRPWAPVVALVAFVGVTLFVGAHHEPWFDEAQAWLIGRDTSLWELLAHRVRYEGSPGLWHALLWCLSHVGFPFAGLFVISVAFASAGAWIILRHAPFPFWLRLGIVFSYFVAYQYAVLARSYAIDVLLFPLLAVLFGARRQRPLLYATLLGLLANTNAHSFIIAGLLGCELLYAGWRAGVWKQRGFLGAIVLLAACGIAAALQAWPPGDVSFTEAARDFGRVGLMIREAFVDRIDLWAGYWPSVFSSFAGAWLSVALLLPSLWLFWRAGQFWLVAIVFMALLVFSVLTYANAWHAGILYLFWIFALWVSWPRLESLSAARAKLVVVSVGAIVMVNYIYAFMAWTYDVRLSYSSGPAAARIVAEQQGSVAAEGVHTFSMQPWFNRNIFANYRDGAPKEVYYQWRRNEPFHFRASLASWKAIVGKDYKTLVLSTATIFEENLPSYMKVAKDAGFCSQEVPGAMVWKSYLREDDRIFVFTRCAP